MARPGKSVCSIGQRRESRRSAVASPQTALSGGGLARLGCASLTVREEPSQTGENEETEQSAERRVEFRIGAVLAIGVAAAFIVWAAVGSVGDDEPAATTAATGAGPVTVSRGGLATLVGAMGQPVYWVGPRSGTLYELQQLPDGEVYVRYLPAGAHAGDDQALLTVGTYPMADAYAVTRSHAASEGAIAVDGGGVAFTSNPTDVYVAFPDADYQIEVYDPKPDVARRLVERGALRTVPPAEPAEVRAVTPSELRNLSNERSQPIYWAGRQPGSTYELTENTEGWIYVRYLREGVEVADPGPQRTIGTYPFSDAYEQTKALADEPGMKLVELEGGGIGVFGEGADVTHGYVAYPDSDFQAEVFDPTPGVAADLIASGKIVPVG